VSYTPEPEVTWGDIKKAIDTATGSLPRVPAALKAGDRVKVVRALDEAGEEYVGAIGTIGTVGSEAIGYDFYVRFYLQPNELGFYRSELEKVAA
jgi:hypothetical protein